MMSHNIGFEGVIWKIISQISLYPFLSGALLYIMNIIDFRICKRVWKIRKCQRKATEGIFKSTGTDCAMIYMYKEQFCLHSNI